MDTSSFDTKMAQLREEEVSKAGRPKGPETAQFRIQVKMAHLQGIKNWFKSQYGYDQPDDYWVRAAEGLPEHKVPVLHGDPVGIVYSGQTAVDELKKQLAMVLDDNEKLTNENKGLEGKLQRVARMTDNEKLRAFIVKHDNYVAAVEKKYGSAQFSQ